MRGLIDHALSLVRSTVQTYWDHRKLRKNERALYERLVRELGERVNHAKECRPQQ